MIETMIYVLAGAFTIGLPLFYFLRERKASAESSAILQKAVERGLDEPASIHPTVDPNSCIGTGACVKACPETKVLGLIDGKARLISPSRCIGHALCAEACPVDAIELVFGTAKRGVDIPVLTGDFESNVPGIYIAGELGGMGLVRNAVTQGRQAMEAIAKSMVGQPKVDGVFDVAIIGAGPAGLGAALQAKKENLNYVLLDQENLGGTILTYPRRKLVMTQPMELPLHGLVNSKEISKEALLELFSKVAAATGLIVRSREKVESIVQQDGHFKIATNKEVIEASKVVLAIGRNGSPRKLGVPGENGGKVTYRLLDPEKFHDLKILVVGGGDSAVEAAVALSEQKGNTVHISYRRENFFRIKEGNMDRIEAAIHQGKVFPLFNSDVKEITPDKVIMEQNGVHLELENEQIFVFAGGEVPSEFLSRVGIEFVRKHGQK